MGAAWWTGWRRAACWSVVWTLPTRRIRRLHLLPAAEPILTEIQRYKDELFAEVTEGLDAATLETVTNALLRMKTQLTTEHAPRHAAAGE